MITKFTISILSLLALVMPIFSANADELMLDKMEITVETTSNFQKKSLTNGVVFFLNRNYTIYGVIDPLLSYDYLSSDGGVSDDGKVHDGTIIPSRDGDIYIIASPFRAIPGWTLIAGTEFYYKAGAGTGTMSLFKKTVTVGQRVKIPIVDDFYEAKPFAKSIVLNKIVPADAMSVTVEVIAADSTSFVKSSFVNDAILFTNYTYPISDVSVSFQGFDFLANDGAKIDRGVIIPSASGFIYVAAKPGGLIGWSLVENATFYYGTSSPTEMSIYKKKVVADERIEMPLLNDFQGVTPIAKTINLQIRPAAQIAELKSILVDGESVSSFMRETMNSSYMLPYTYKQSPIVSAVALSANATMAIQMVEDPKGTEEERTATITVKSEDNSKTKVYKVTFRVLPELDLYLCIGESNMVGYAPLDELLGDLKLMDNSFLLNNTNRFEVASNPLNRYSTTDTIGAKALLGPAYSFAKSINRRSDVPVGLIVNARGGSSIENWAKGATGSDKGALYSSTLARALEAKKWGGFKAILWHQGEANKADAVSYPAKVSQFINNLRADLNEPDLLFVAGQIGAFGSNVTEFNTMINSISTFVNNSACVSSADLTNIVGDTNHFDRASAITLGERYAKTVVEKLYLPEQTDITIEADVGVFVKKLLKKNTELFLNRPTYLISNDAFSGFENFEFLSSNAGETENGVMIPSTDGRLYIIADNGLSIRGWSPLFGTEIYYSKAEMCIYSRKVTAGERVPLPLVTNFIGVSPLAKQIHLSEISPGKDARVDSILVGGVALKGFNKNILEYKYNLPYSALTVPIVAVKAYATGAVVNITNALNINGSITERTTTINVSSQDKTVTQNYKIIFEVLPELDLYLCIGQSNMAGAAPLDVTKGDLDIIDNAFLFNADKLFEPAQNSMNRYANVLTTTTHYYGPSYSFAKKVVAQTGKKIGLFVNARGGSSIEQWVKGGIGAGDSLYSKTIEMAVEAQKWGKYKAVLWHQGEANQTTTASYPAKLTQLVANFRSDLNNPQLLFVAGQIGQWNPINAQFNAMISSISSFINYSGCALTDDLINITNLSDYNSHFNREGLKVLGERYAEIVIQNIYTGIPSNLQQTQNASLYVKNNKLYIDGLSELYDTNCNVFDISGRMVQQQKLRGNAAITLRTKGLFIVSLENQEIKTNSKIIIQ